MGSAVGEPLPNPGIVRLEWDDDNIDHLEEPRHKATVADVYEVLFGRPRFFENSPGTNRSGSHVIIGQNDAGKFFYIVLVETEEIGVWRVVTGWRKPQGQVQRSIRGESNHEEEL